MRRWVRVDSTKLCRMMSVAVADQVEKDACVDKKQAGVMGRLNSEGGVGEDAGSCGCRRSL